jgi:hypothetical protein
MPKYAQYNNTEASIRTQLDAEPMPTVKRQRERKHVTYINSVRTSQEVTGGEGVAKDTTSKWGARNKYCCSERSQAMPASPSDSVKFKFNVKKV